MNDLDFLLIFILTRAHAAVFVFPQLHINPRCWRLHSIQEAAYEPAPFIFEERRSARIWWN
jgi:hypothetical protein